MLKNIKIGHRLWAWMLIVILLVGILGLFTYSRILILEEAFEEVREEFEEMHQVVSLSLAVSKSVMPPNDYLIPGANPNERWNFMHFTRQVEEKFNELEEHTINHPEEEKVFKQAKSNYFEFKRIALQIFDTFSYDDSSKLDEVGPIMEEMDVSNDRVLSTLDSWHVLVIDEIREKTEEFEKTQNEILITIIIIISLIILMSVFIGIIVIRSITSPISELVAITQVIAKGDLTKRIGAVSKDEIGQLAISFNKMIDRIKESRKDIDNKVGQQTEDIIEQKSRLEDQQKAILNILGDVEEERDNVSTERDKINAILQSIGDGVFVVDSKYEIIMFNQVASDISGFSVSEAIGNRYDKILRFTHEDEDKVNNEFVIEAIKTGEVKEMSNHTVLIRKDGSKIPVADSAAPLKDKKGKVLGCVVVFRDVTKEREVDRAKSEFVSLASHQLRTPLSAINWYTEMLMTGDAGKLSKNQKKYLEEIYAGNQRMVDLVNALLNVSRIELGTFSIEPEKVKLVDICNSVLEELAVKIKDKKLKVDKKYGKNIPIMKLDPKLMRIIFQNFISNAVKYTPEKGKVNISIEKKEKHILIKISDTGYGIPKEQQSKIFSKLFRADNVREKETDGTGLGLYIVKAVIEQSGGKTWFESIEDKGTTFYATIPLKGMNKKGGTKGLTSG